MGEIPELKPDANVTPRRRLEGEFLLALRRAGSVMQLLGAAAAERIGINVTDLNCLNILALRGRMTAGELATATGLSTASITGVLDRLEEAGFVQRERDLKDRRRVLVRLDPQRGLHDIAPVFAPVVAAWRAVAAQYTDEQLETILGFQHQVEQIMRDRLIELRGGTPALRRCGGCPEADTPNSGAGIGGCRERTGRVRGYPGAGAGTGWWCGSYLPGDRPPVVPPEACAGWASTSRRGARCPSPA